MTISAQYWPYLMAVLYLVGALLSAGAGLWIARFGDRERPDRVALLAACTAMTVWCAATITLPPDHAGTELALTARNLALIMLIFRLFATDGRDASLKPIRPVVIALALVELFQPVLLFINIQVATFPELVQLTFEIGAMLNMLVAIGALVLLHNLYAGATASSRRMIRWSALGLAVIFGYDLNFLEKYYDDIVVLQNANAQVIVSPALQGRVMTSTASGEEGLSFGFDIILEGFLGHRVRSCR